ncbi:hypothetical protein SNE40_015613 [Patella caerulea]|uniref:BHLH domain-containing protein n=1 Tax=Patella caerulea TaxID=87958 RepID=A0AAN8JLI2_PATCE
MESQSYTSFRKGRKLLAEKKRRNRINECLKQIKNLLCEDSVSYQTELGANNMEKAEILESAVEFIKKTIYPCPREDQFKYQKGFTRCFQEMTSFLSGVTEVSDNVKYALIQHVNRNIQSTQYDRNIKYLHYPGISTNINGQYSPRSENQNYIRYNPSLAVPLDRHNYRQNIKTETTIDSNNNNNSCINNNNNSCINNSNNSCIGNNNMNNNSSVWRPW